MQNIKVNDHFNCIVCNYLVDDPMECELCGKLYCQSCSINICYCKWCKKNTKLRKSMFAKNLLLQVELKCKNSKCKNRLPYEEMKKHLLVCEHKLTRCSIDFCYF